MTIEHSTITDPYLHEPKGIAAATISKVYVSDGAGSGTWTAVASLLSNTDNFSSKLLQVIGTSTQSLTGAWDVRKLDTVLFNGISGASVNTSTGTITLPSGTFLVVSEAVGFNMTASGTTITSAITRLRDTSASSTILVGTPAAISYSTNAENGSTNYTKFAGQSLLCPLGGYFVAASSHTYQLQWWSNVATQTNNSVLAGSGETPTLTNIYIWKIA